MEGGKGGALLWPQPEPSSQRVAGNCRDTRTKVAKTRTRSDSVGSVGFQSAGSLGLALLGSTGLPRPCPQRREKELRL
jgi:hypothetical protein